MKILTIGIYCKGIVELHKNGANSQVFFINELIKNLEGYTPVLFSSYLNSDRVKDRTNIAYLSHKKTIYNINNNSSLNLLLNQDIIIYLSKTITNTNILNMIKLKKIPTVYYNCEIVLYLSRKYSV